MPESLPVRNSNSDACRLKASRPMVVWNAQVDGFTLVEMVVAILILGVISAVTIARFADGNAANGIVLRDQIVASVRQAQQSAFGREDVEFRLTPNVSGSEATIEVSEANGMIIQTTVPMASVSLNADRDVTSSCGVTPGSNAVTSANPIVIDFGGLGEITSAEVGGSSGAVNTSLKICVDNQTVTSVCISPAGFAYVGDCDVD